MKRYTFHFTCREEKKEIEADSFEDALTAAFESFESPSVQDIYLTRFEINTEEVSEVSKRNGGKHTPGPWEVGGLWETDERVVYGPNGEDSCIIATVWPNGSNDFNEDYPQEDNNGFAVDKMRLLLGESTENVSVREANARLIAAAPDLLAALKGILDGGGSPNWSDVAREAIAKAEERGRR
jgi:hypothetical protein